MDFSQGKFIDRKQKGADPWSKAHLWHRERKRSLREDYSEQLLCASRCARLWRNQDDYYPDPALKAPTVCKNIRGYYHHQPWTVLTEEMSKRNRESSTEYLISIKGDYKGRILESLLHACRHTVHF